MNAQQPESISVSIVTPVYSGEDYLVRFVDEIAATREDWKKRSVPVEIREVIFVDDSAIDGSPEILDELSERYDWIRVFHMSRNYGQHAATVAGIMKSSGDWVATLDEDLQHPPGELLKMLALAIEGRDDVVYARPRRAVHNSLFRDGSSRSVKFLLQKLTGNPHIRKANSFRLMRGAIARGASEACSHDTYFDVALSWFTKRFSSISLDLLDQRFQQTGKSGYSLRSLMTHARRMIMSSEIKALRFSTYLAAIFISAMFVWSLYVLVKATFFRDDYSGPAGWPSLMLSILVTSAVTIFLLSVMLEYVSLLAQKAHGRPQYFFIDRSRDSIFATYLDQHPELIETIVPALPEREIEVLGQGRKPRFRFLTSIQAVGATMLALVATFLLVGAYLY